MEAAAAMAPHGGGFMNHDMSELFYKDEYLKEFDATVQSCEAAGSGFAVVLDRTAFYPEGGGQPADHGQLGGARVTDVKRRDGQVIHYTDKMLPAGSFVHGVIDWERRFDHMQNHSGEHIVSGIVHSLYGYDNVGFHMGETILVDFNGTLTWEQALDIEKRANEVIWADKETLVTYPSEVERLSLDYRSKKALTGTVRIVEFPGADRCACCGTHVARAGEVGMVKMISLMNHRGGVRLEMLSGRRAMAYIDATVDNNAEIGRQFSVKPIQTVQAVEKAKAETAELRQKLTEANRRYFRVRAGALPSSGVAVAVEEDMDPGELRKGCDVLLETGSAAVYVLLSPAGKDTCRYVIGSRGFDVRPAGKSLNGRLSGRGGGSREAVQGTFHAPLAEVEAALREEIGSGALAGAE